MVGSLAAGAIDGFCAGAPWSQVAAHSGLGFTAINTGQIWRNHPEKCLALRADFAAGDPAAVRALMRALGSAARFCADPACREDISQMLSVAEFLDLPAPLIAQSLDPAAGGPLFTQNYPSPAHAAWFAAQLLRWDKVPSDAVIAAAALYHPDLFIAAGGKSPEAYKEIFCDSEVSQSA
jgi:ABC-type nitrate/sulfonate/bicarbonate transport system substrate-binding protein